MRTTLVVFPLLLATLGLTAAEDRLILTDGRTIDGIYLGGDAQEVRLRYGATDLVIPREKVQRIDLAAAPAMPPAQPAAPVNPPPTQVVYAPAPQPAPQIVYVPQPAPQVVYAPVSYPATSWYIGTGWYGSPWRNHCGPWGHGWNSWRPGLSIGFQGNFSNR